MSGSFASFLPPNGAVVHGSQPVREAQFSGAPTFGPDSVGTFEILASGSDRNPGYLTGRQVATVALGEGARTDMTLRIIEVFRRERNQWMLVPATRTPSIRASELRTQ